MQLFDTHCHIHSVDYPTPISEVDARCAEASVGYMVCVGENAADSERAVAFVRDRPTSWAAIGQHPHEAGEGSGPLEKLRALLSAGASIHVSRRSLPSSSSTVVEPGEEIALAIDARAGEDKKWSEKAVYTNQTATGPATKSEPPGVLASTLRAREPSLLVSPVTDLGDDSTGEGAEAPADADIASSAIQRADKIVAIGECGLDYFYGHSSKEDQEIALRFQIELALEHDLPLIFHVRDAFDDFWPIFDSYSGVRGILHSFTDNAQNAEKALERGLFIGVNGIMTFTKNQSQLDLLRQLPLERIVLETDSPFLTPSPMRGKVNEPARVMLVAEFVSNLRQLSLTEIADQTTTNARHVFSI